MVRDDPVYRLVKMPDRLESAESIGDAGAVKDNLRYFESAFMTVRNSWADLLKADRKLDEQYSVNLSGEDMEPAEISYSVNLDRIDEDSHPAIIGMSLPRYFELLRETEGYLKERFEELDVDSKPSHYPSSEVLPKESKDFQKILNCEDRKPRSAGENQAGLY